MSGFQHYGNEGQVKSVSSVGVEVAQVVFAVLAIAEEGAFFAAVDAFQGHLSLLVAAFQFSNFGIQIEEVFVAFLRERA